MYVRPDGIKFLRPLNVLAFLIVLPQFCSTSHDDLLFNNTAVYRVEFVLDQQDIHAVFIDLRLLTGLFQLKARHDNYWYSKNHCSRRQVSIWQKHGYVCLFLPADDLTICMDILPNPGPVSPISSPRNDSVYKLGGKNLHVRPNHIQYSRSASSVWEPRFESGLEYSLKPKGDWFTQVSRVSCWKGQKFCE